MVQGSTPGAYQSSFSGTARGAGTSFNPAHPSTSTSAGLSPYSNLSNASRTFAQPPAIYTRASYTPGMSTTSAQDVPAQGRPKTMEEELAAIRSRTQAAHNQPAVPRALEPLPVSGHGSPSPATSMHGLQQSAIRPSLQSISQPISQPRLSLLGSNARAATSQSDERQQAAAQPASAHTESAQLSTELQQLPQTQPQAGSGSDVLWADAAQGSRPSQVDGATESHASGGVGTAAVQVPTHRLQRTASMLSQEVRSPSPAVRSATKQALLPHLKREVAAPSQQAASQHQAPPGTDDQPSGSADQSARHPILDSLNPAARAGLMSQVAHHGADEIKDVMESSAREELTLTSPVAKVTEKPKRRSGVTHSRPAGSDSSIRRQDIGEHYSCKSISGHKGLRQIKRVDYAFFHKSTVFAARSSRYPLHDIFNGLFIPTQHSISLHQIMTSCASSCYEA